MSNLLNAASLVLTPNSYKEGKLYSVIPNTGAGDMTVVRATTATRVNSAGLVELVPYNLLSYSNAFNTSPWAMNVTSGQAGKDGQNNAWLLTKVTATTSDFYNSNVYNGDQTFTIYVKKESGKGFKLYPIGTTTEFSEVNLQTGVVYFSTSGITSTTVEAYSSTWWKISVALNMINSSYYIYVTDGAGTQIASSITIQDAQVNIGLTAKPYFPTTDRLNIPRLDYSNGTCPSLLVEPQRTNSCLYSEQFDNAAWSKDNVTVTANSNISPDGTQNADTIIGNGINTSHYIYNSAYSVVSGNTYTISTYAKKNTNNFIQLQGFSSAFGVNVWANFDLNNGVVGSIGSATTAKIEDAGNGWYRCSITGQATSTTLTVDILFLVTSATSIRGESNTLSTSVYLWGFQSELGSYATSYIPTTSASVTRNADVLTRNNIYTNGLITAAGGTWFVELRMPTIARDNGNEIISITDTTGQNQLFIYGGIGIYTYIIGKFIGGAFTNIYFSTVNQNNQIKLAIKWNGATADVFQNGVKVVSATAFTSTNMQFLRTGTSGVGAPAFINEMALFPTPLSDDQLEALTGEGFNTYAEMASYYNYTLQ